MTRWFFKFPVIFQLYPSQITISTECPMTVSRNLPIYSVYSQNFPAFSHHFPMTSVIFRWFPMILAQKPTGFPKLTGAWLKLCCCWCLKSSSSCDNLKRQTELKPWPVGTNLGSKTSVETLWLCQNSYWEWPFIVDFPIKNGDVWWCQQFAIEND